MTVNRVLVVGSNGLLGQKVAELLVRGSNYELMLASVEGSPVRDLMSVEYTQLDITSRKATRDVVASFRPDVIINCAAMTNVDACETEREVAWKINVTGVENLAEAAKKAGGRILHVSSDYVFDGKNGPYAEEDRPEPISYYGKSKLASENALRTSEVPFFIARTMVLYGFAPGVKENFALWLIRSLRDGQPVRVVDDQIGNPTLVDDLAFGLIRGMELARTGIYHLAGREIMSRFEFAGRLAEVFDLPVDLIQPIKTASLRQPAPRPLNSGLVTLKAEVELGFRPSTVEEGLQLLRSQLQQAEQWEERNT